jgi:UPF0754 membrane protein sca_1420
MTPVIGAIIGYITNDIAIKMLFHPKRAKYIGRWKIPFTPGLIPKERDRIAKSIGNVISSQLLNSNVISEALVSEQMIERIKKGIIRFVDNNRKNETIIEEFLISISTQDRVYEIIHNIKNDTSNLIYRKLTAFNLGEVISNSIVDKVKEKISSTMFSFMLNLFDDEAIEALSINLGNQIDELIEENADGIIKEMLGNEIDKIKNMKICDVIEKYNGNIPDIIEFLIKNYKKFVINNLPKLLIKINLAKIVENRISAFDVDELENMIFGIMDKELNAIVYLGALLGFIMGLVNLAIQLI